MKSWRRPGVGSGRGSGSCPSEWGRLRPAHSAVRLGEGAVLASLCVWEGVPPHLPVPGRLAHPDRVNKMGPVGER